MQNGFHIAVRLRDKESYDELREILRYESAVRGQAMGKTAFDLVMSAVDTSSYPEEARSLLEARK